MDGVHNAFCRFSKHCLALHSLHSQGEAFHRGFGVLHGGEYVHLHDMSSLLIWVLLVWHNDFSSGYYK